MKRSLTYLLFAVFAVVSFVELAFADIGGLAKEVFASYGGWLLVLYIVFRVGIWIIRKTESSKDDAALDNFAAKGVEFALAVMPKNTNVNWLKFLGNALGKFTEAYVKSKNDLPDDSTLEKAKKLIKEIAEQKEILNEAKN